MEEQRLTRFIRILKNQSTPTTQRLAALDRLKTSDDPAVIAVIANTCLGNAPTISAKSREIISNLSYEHVSSLLDFLLSGANAGYMGRKVFQILHELKSRDLLKYIIEFALHAQADDSRRKTIAAWMQDLRITDDYVQKLLNLPTSDGSQPDALTLTFGRVLRQIDERIVTDLAKRIKEAPTDVSLRGLGILEGIAQGSNISHSLLMAILREADDEKVRSKAIKTAVRISGNLRVIKETLKDEKDARIRANALELLWEVKDPVLQGQAIAMATPHLNDPNNRARANAARALYEMGDARGLATFMKMLDHPDAPMRASAAWMVGEIREESAIDKLKTLVKTDPSTSVVENAQRALDQMDFLAIQVKELLPSLCHFTYSDSQSGLPTDNDYLLMLKLLRRRDVQELVDMAQAIQDTSPDLCREMLKQIENGSDEANALTLLLAAAYCRDNRVRSKAALLIVRTGMNEDVFYHFWGDTDSRVKANALEALEGCSAPFVVPILVDNLKSENNRLLANAAKALCQLDDSRGRDTLLINLRHPEPAFRASCVWALGEVSNTDIEEQLELLKQDSDTNVRRHVQIALDKILARNRKAPDEIAVKIRHIDVKRYPTVDCYVSVESKEEAITELTSENFTVKENRIPLSFELSSQEDAVQHLSVAILMDYSLSMSEQDLWAMEAAVDHLIDTLDERDQAAIIKFSRYVSIDQDLTTDRGALHAVVHEAHMDNQGGTVLYDAIYAAIQLIRHSEGLKSIIVLTDGEDSNSNISKRQVIGAASGQNNTIYTIGLGEDPDRNTLAQIAESTGGWFFSAGGAEALEGIYRQISQALHSHYVLTYQSRSSSVKGISLLTVDVTCGKAASQDTIPLPEAPSRRTREDIINL